jgi:hypothetical protein
MEYTNTRKIILGSWMTGISNIRIIKLSERSTKATTAAKSNGDEFMKYFITSQGRAAWQDMYL